MEKRPTESELAVLRNLAAGKDFTHGLSPDVAAPAMFRCIMNHWASGGRITDKGRAMLQPAKGNYEITIVREEKPPILLPPIGGWKEQV